MTKVKKASFNEVYASWKILRSSFDRMEKGVLILMRHRDVTPEQLMEAHALYQDSYKRMCAMQDNLIEKSAGSFMLDKYFNTPVSLAEPRETA
jgi:hypothetical protein